MRFHKGTETSIDTVLAVRFQNDNIKTMLFFSLGSQVRFSKRSPYFVLELADNVVCSGKW